MSIQAGDKIPAETLYKMGAEGPEAVSTAELFAGKRVVLFALPGAFTPTCSKSHLPGFVVHADNLRAKGVDLIVCLSVNDAFVMNAWGESQNVEDRVLMLADGSAAFTRALGLDQDLSARGMGVRSQRYAMVVDDGIVSSLHVERAGAFEVSKAEAILATL